MTNEQKRCSLRAAVFFIATLMLGMAAPAAAGTFLTSPLDFSKGFVPDTIGPGSTSMLVFTIVNNEAETDEELAFQDTFPLGITLAAPAFVSNTCGGTVTAMSGGNTVALTGGVIGAAGPNGACEIVVNVTAANPTEGSYSNTTGDLMSVAGNSGNASADLIITEALPGFTKVFSPSTVEFGERSTLTFTIDNTNNGLNVESLNFVDDLPDGMLVASPANASTDCGDPAVPPTLTADAGSSSISLSAFGTPSFPALAAQALCTVEVDVIGGAVGELGNVTEELLLSIGTENTSAGKASAVLEVTGAGDLLVLTKAFTDDPVIPGGTANLEFTVLNRSRTDAATGVTFDDVLDPLDSLTGLVPAETLPKAACGGTLDFAADALTLTGGSLPAEGSCTFSVSLSVPAGALPGAYTNTTSAVSGEVGGSPKTGNTASDMLFVAPFPVLTKEFLEDGSLLPDPVINAGEDVVLRFTVTNTSTTSTATDVAFDDELTDNTGNPGGSIGNGFLPFPVSVTLPPVPDPPCGAGSSLALVSAGTDRQALQLTGGTLDAAPGAGSTCSFDVTLTIPEGLGPGVYTNTTEQPTATVDGATRTGTPASDTLTVIAAPSLSKAFTDDPVAPGDLVTLEFTLEYSPDASGDATAITFTDNLAPVLAGLVATGLPLTEACDPDGPGGDPGTGTLSGSAGDTLLTFMDGTLSPGESCTVSVTLAVPAGAAFGTYPNTTSDVGATVDGLAATSGPASDTLSIAPLVFSKEFLDNPMIAGDTTTLRFTIENKGTTSPADDATINFFTDNLQANLPGLAATGPVSLDTCGGSLSGTTFLFYTGGSVAAGATCTIEVEVLVPLGTDDGDYLNITSNLSADVGGPVTIDPATDVLEVSSTLLQITKEFTDDPVPPGGTVTLEFTLENLSATETVTEIVFSDDLGTSTGALEGLMATGALVNDCGGMGTIGFPTDFFTYAGGSLGPAESCTVTLSVDVPAAPLLDEPPFINTTTVVQGEVGALDVTGDPASDELIVQELAFSKEFTDDPAVPGGTATLSFTIENLSNEAIDDLAFSDNLDDVIPGLTATGLPPAGFCGPASTIGGGSFVTVAGASLAPAGSAGDEDVCTFAVTVTVPTEPAVCGSFTNATSPLTQQGIPVADPATALLDVVNQASGAFIQTGGIASIEAENYSVIVDGLTSDGQPASWDLLDPVPDASNTQAIIASMGLGSPPSQAPYVEYEVQLEAGSQYVWLRYRSVVSHEISIYFQYDDGPIQGIQLPIPQTSWAWAQLPIKDPINVAEDGEIHTVKIYRRKNKTELDKLIITRDLDLNPELINDGLGPQESPRQTSCTDTDGDGDPDITDPDDDGDGMSDEFEIANGLDPLDPNDADDDNDGDGLTNLEEFEKNPNLDPNSPDTDDDGIGDQFDDDPINPSNACDFGSNADYATFSQQVTMELTCAARGRIDAIPPSGVLSPGGDLTLIAPIVALLNGFGVESIPGERSLRIINADPCPNCNNSVAPEVKTTAPADFATGVPVDSNIEITFSEPVNVTGNWVEISCTVSGYYSPIPPTSVMQVSVTDTDPLFTLDPDPDFAPGETCYVTVFAANVTDDDSIDPPDNMDADYLFSFTVDADLDFGDAPDPLDATDGEYPTLFANDGARHVLPPSPVLFLGSIVDMDLDGQPSSSADGDDNDGTDDEDGVDFLTLLTKGISANVEVTASDTGLLNAWVDFNQDGDWDDLGEQIFTDESLTGGINSLSYPVPADASDGITAARFRLSTAGGDMPTGLAPNGEVEDYLVTIVEQAAPDAIEDALTALQNTSPVLDAAADNGSGADSFGTPAAEVDFYGPVGGPLVTTPGNPFALASGNTVNFAGGASDGTFTYDATVNPTFTGTDTFEYQLTNTAGSDSAVVTITVQALPDAMDDALTTVEDTDLSEDLFADNGSGTDDLGSPAATIASFGGGDLGGDATLNAAGSSVGLAGGTLTVNANGSITLNGQPFTAGTYTFDYRLTNAAGSDDATVTITIDTTAPTTTVTIDSITDDTGTPGDFITSDNDGLTIGATLSAALAAGETLEYSNDNGATFTDISGSVSGTAVTHVDAALTSTNTIQMRVTDGASNGPTASKLVTIDTTAPTTTVTIDSITDDTGTPGDFITNDDDGLTIGATLSAALAAGEMLEYSNDNGVTFTDITTSISGTAVTHVDASLTSTNTIQMRVTDGASNGPTASKLVTIDTTAPTTTVTIDSITDDTGTPGDFMTADSDGLTIGATLSAGLAAGEKLEYSNDNGATFTDISGSVSGTAVTHVDAALTSTNTIQMQVADGANFGPTASQLVTIIPNTAPTAVNDSYTALPVNVLLDAGGVTVSGVEVNDADGLLTKGTDDSDPEADPLTVTKVQATVVPGGGSASAATSGGGTVTMNSDGTFTYVSEVGESAATDTFTYEISDGALTDTATVTITFTANTIWFIDDSAAAGGNGRSNNPFDTTTAFNAATTGTGDFVFLHTGTYNGADGVDLLNNQQLIGEGAGLTDGNLTIAVGTPPTLASTGDNGINLAANNTIRGLDIGNTTGTGMNGTEVGTLTVTEVGISGTGGGVDLRSTTGAAISVSLDSLSASSSTDEGILLSGVSGSFSITATDGTISNTAVPAVDITGAADPNEVSLGITFESVSADGGGVGIELTNTTGSFTVAGDGSTATQGGNDTGGVIKSISGDGIVLSNTENITFANMTIGDTAATPADSPDATNNIVGDGIQATGVTGLSLSNTTIARTGAHGVNAVSVGGAASVTGLVVDDSLLLNAGDGQEEHGLNLDELRGDNFVRDSQFDAFNETAIEVVNASGQVDLTISNTRFQDNKATVGNAGEEAILIEALGSANIVVLVTGGSVFDDIATQAIQAISTGSSSMIHLTVQNSSFVEHSSGDGIIIMNPDGGGSGNLTVKDNMITDDTFGPFAIIAKNDSSGTLDATIQSNTVDNMNMLLVNHDDIGGAGAANGTSRILVDNNINNVGTNNISIDIIATETGPVGTDPDLSVTVLNNTSNQPDNNFTFTPGLRIDAQNNSRLIANISGNAFQGDPTFAGGSGIELRELDSAVVGLQGFGGGAPGNCAAPGSDPVSTFLDTANPLSVDVSFVCSEVDNNIGTGTATLPTATTLPSP